MSDDAQFQTKRTDLLNAYKRNGVPFLATTRGLHSVRSLEFNAVNIDAATNVIGYLVARRGQNLVFFNYGINDAIQLAANGAHRATEADTSLTKGSRTTASADLSIEWITMHPRAIKTNYQVAVPPLAPYLQWALPGTVAATDPIVIAGVSGSASIVDPFSQVVPTAVGSSATLQHVLYQAIAPFLTCRFEWDNADRTEKMGTCDQFVEGGGASYLNSNGDPSVNNRFRIPEGFLWARESQPASELQVICTLQNDVIIPYTPVLAPLAAGGMPILTSVYVEILMRLGGMLLRVPGSN
jgi:hypothetical protein